MKKIFILSLFLFFLTGCQSFENRYYDENYSLPKYDKIVEKKFNSSNSCKEEDEIVDGKNIIKTYSYCYVGNDYQKYLDYLKKEKLTYREENGGWFSYTLVGKEYDKYYSIIQDYKVVAELLVKDDKVTIQTYQGDYVIDADARRMNAGDTINGILINTMDFDEENQIIKMKFRFEDDYKPITDTITIIYDGKPIKPKVTYSNNEITMNKFGKKLKKEKIDKIVFSDMKYKYEYFMN